MTVKTPKERPILFSAPMVRAILDGRKTQTRRRIRCQSDLDFDDGWPLAEDECGIWARISCPYGQRGDRLWVREEHYKFGHWEPIPNVKTKTGRQKWRFVADRQTTLYEPPVGLRSRRDYSDKPHWYKRLARFMPRAASRITLEITGVRVERLQDISRGDAMAEGCPFANMADGPNPRHWYADLWKQINGAGSWDTNPWVWVVEFNSLESANA